MIEETEFEHHPTLSRAERLQLTCALFLPDALLGLAWMLLKGQLRISELHPQYIGLVFGLS